MVYQSQTTKIDNRNGQFLVLSDCLEFNSLDSKANIMEYEDIFNSATDALELVLRFGDHTHEKFDKAKFQYNFEKIKSEIAEKDLPCFFAKQSEDKNGQGAEHKIIIPPDKS
jgi:hypothetical protein